MHKMDLPKKSRFYPERSAIHTKRARMTNLNSQTPIFQVHGEITEMDVNSSKDFSLNGD
uniref:Uncharacterized protein n=1 Tax=Nelumbo nucifera TaxID=4432 RepID=A0A822Z845_NELNU|nr:TPA_asm: hypothetical protein HUJ06_015350 [Nelumbo nucifera]